MNLITVRGMTVRLANRMVLRDINLEVEKGEIVTIVGPNGSGKTTLLRALVGSIPFSGSINSKPGLRIGYVPQRLHLDANLPLTVERFLQLGTPKIKGGAKRVLAELELPDFTGQQMSSLSGGQFQRVLLARALLSEPDLLLLDEPAQSLDPPAIVSLYRIVSETRNKRNCGVLMVSHDLHVVMGETDRVIGLNGVILCEGPPTVISSAREYRTFFGQLEPFALALNPFDNKDGRD